MRKKGREKISEGPEKTFAAGPGRLPSQQENDQRKKNKKQGGYLSEGEVLIGKAPPYSNTPWAPSGPERI